MKTNILQKINSLNTENFSDYKFLAFDMREIIEKFDEKNINESIEYNDIDGYYFETNSIDLIKSRFNQKLDEFYKGFFGTKELIRKEIKNNPRLLKDINLNSYNYFFAMTSRTIQSPSYGPISLDKTQSRVNRFRQAYNSEYYLKAKQKEGCFIATYAYNSYNHENVIVLREFRDNTLKKYKLGKFFIKKYYKYSPSIVLIFKKIKFMKLPIRKTIDIIVSFVKK